MHKAKPQALQLFREFTMANKAAEFDAKVLKFGDVTFDKVGVLLPSAFVVRRAGASLVPSSSWKMVLSSCESGVIVWERIAHPTCAAGSWELVC